MKNFETYQEMRQVLGRLFDEGQLDEAVQLLSWALDAFPDHLRANIFNLAYIHAQKGDFQDALKVLRMGLDKAQVWFGPLEMAEEGWTRVKTLSGYQAIQKEYERLYQAAQKAARTELKVQTPEDYDPSLHYPLFIALHGGGETLADFMPNWRSPKLRSEFIVAYPQSSRVISMNGFSWMGDEMDRQEIAAVYAQVVRDYAVDSKQVLTGGFSAGGHQVLTLLLDETPVVRSCGFVALCPQVPEVEDPQAACGIAARGQRGVLLTTEMDQRIEDQKAFAEKLQEAGVPLRVVVTPNIGHWYPADLPEQIDSAIDFIFEKPDVS